MDTRRLNHEWVETDFRQYMKDEIDDLLLMYDLILDKWDYNIYLFGVAIKLSPQEYKFLKTVLKASNNIENTKTKTTKTEINQEIKSITALELMKKISVRAGSKNEKIKNNNSIKRKSKIAYAYRIRNKIKKKIKLGLINYAVNRYNGIDIEQAKKGCFVLKDFDKSKWAAIDNHDIGSERTVRIEEFFNKQILAVRNKRYSSLFKKTKINYFKTRENNENYR